MLKVHLSLAVQDIVATNLFYTALFQSEPVKTKNDYVKFEPADMELNISFTELENGKTADPDHHHLGIQFQSQEMLDDAYARLKKANVVIGDRESSICCYADQDKFNVRDPDGYQWELYYLLADSNLKVAATTSCCAQVSGETSCCN